MRLRYYIKTPSKTTWYMIDETRKEIERDIWIMLQYPRKTRIEIRRNKKVCSVIETKGHTKNNRMIALSLSLQLEQDGTQITEIWNTEEDYRFLDNLDVVGGNHGNKKNYCETLTLVIDLKGEIA